MSSRDYEIRAPLILRSAGLVTALGVSLSASPFVLDGDYTRRGVTISERPLELAIAVIGICLTGAALWSIAAVATRPRPAARMDDGHLVVRTYRDRRVVASQVRRVLVIRQRRDVPDSYRKSIPGEIWRVDMSHFAYYRMIRLTPIIVVETADADPISIPRVYAGDPTELARDIARWVDAPVVTSPALDAVESIVRSAIVPVDDRDVRDGVDRWAARRLAQRLLVCLDAGGGESQLMQYAERFCRDNDINLTADQQRSIAKAASSPLPLDGHYT